MTCQQVKRHSILIAVCAILFAISALPVCAETILIDSFAPPSTTEAFFLRGSQLQLRDYEFVEHARTGILGGERDLLVEMVGDAPYSSTSGVFQTLAGFSPSDANEDEFVGIMKIRTSGRIGTGTSVVLQYDGADSEGEVPDQLVNSRGLNIDLTDGGTNGGFLFSFVSVDGATAMGLDLQILATSISGETTLAQTHYIPNTDSAIDYLIPFADFTDPAVLQNVDSLAFIFNSDRTPNMDFEIESIQAVPEPATLALLGLASLTLLVFHGRSRRKR